MVTEEQDRKQMQNRTKCFSQNLREEILARPKYRCECNIKMNYEEIRYVAVGCIHLARVSIRWRAVLNRHEVGT